MFVGDLMIVGLCLGDGRVGWVLFLLVVVLVGVVVGSR